MLNHCNALWPSVNQYSAKLETTCLLVQQWGGAKGGYFVFCNLGDLQWPPSEKIGTLCMFAQELTATWCTGQEVAMKLVQNISSIINQIKILNILLKLPNGGTNLRLHVFLLKSRGKRMLWNKANTAEASTKYPSIWTWGPTCLFAQEQLGNRRLSTHLMDTRHRADNTSKYNHTQVSNIFVVTVCSDQTSKYI